MANQKKLQQAAIKFRKQNPMLHATCSALLSSMARFITKFGATEVTVGYDKRGEYYEAANN
jgi:hypothetical protein